MTNQQAVVEAGKEIERLKSIYVLHMQKIALKRHEKNHPSLQDLLESQRVANQYFNYVERFVGDSGLLGAHENGKWVTGFAEDCREILNTYVLHANFIKSWSSVLGSTSNPSSNAYSNMQRMVLEYLPKEQSNELKNKFLNNLLPVQGFNMAAIADKTQQPKWQLITSVSVGLTALIASVIIALLIPNPTTYQTFIFRGLFAIALASIGTIIPGFLNFKAHAKTYFSIYAGGAVAIFIIIWLVNPPII